MRTIHSDRKSRFLRRLPTNPYFSDFSTASCAARCSLLLVRKKPLARASVFFRLARRCVPRFTLGTFSPSIYEPDQARSIWPVRRIFLLVRKHSLYFRRIGGIGDVGLGQTALPRA